MAHILVVDDRAINRDYLVTLLGYDGHTFSQAADGVEALEALAAHAADLVITDIDMPGMGGVEFVERMQRDPRGARIPVIFHSATYRVPEARRLAGACVAAGFIPKPSDPEAVVAAVRSALGMAREAPQVPSSSRGTAAFMALMDFQCALAEERDPGTVLELACRAAPKLVSAQSAVLVLESRETGLVEKTFTHGIDSAATFPAGSPGALVVPVQGSRARYGWLHVAHAANGEPFTAADEEILGMLARLAAVAHENGLLAVEASCDALTGLPNRRELEAALARELQRAGRGGCSFGVVMADVDHFKRCNDRHGHAGGDAVLRGLAAFLAKSVRGYDQVFRFGGEEFTLLFPGATLRDAVARAEQIREGVKALDLSHEGRPMGPVTISLGVAAFPANGRSAETLLGEADRALYRAKETGRDRTCAAADAKGN